ncbi:MAG: hypothetical protein ACLVB1_06235 [Blautia obeum]
MSYPFVNLVFGTHNIFKYAELYEMLQSEQEIVDIWEGTDQIVEDLPTERNYTFKSGVNIMFDATISAVTALSHMCVDVSEAVSRRQS